MRETVAGPNLCDYSTVDFIWSHALRMWTKKKRRNHLVAIIAHLEKTRRNYLVAPVRTWKIACFEDHLLAIAPTSAALCNSLLKSVLQIRTVYYVLKTVQSFWQGGLALLKITN